MTSQASGQQVALSLGSGSGTPGSIVTLSLSLTASGGAQPAGLQWTIGYSANIISVVETIGSAASAAGKSMQCNYQSGTATCLVIGFNTTTIGDGTVATVAFTIAPDTPSTSVPVTLSRISATTGGGTSIPASGTGTEMQIGVPRDEAAIFTARNAADLESTEFCSPGSWASLFGVAFTTIDPIAAATVPLPTSLGGVEVRVDDMPVPLLYVSESQINFQCPRLPGPMDSAIQVTVKAETGVTTSPFSGFMRETTPGLFTLNASGTGQGVVLIAGSYEVAMPTTNEIPSRPARRGEFLSIYANGLGEVQEEIPVGSPAPLDRVIRLKNVVRVFLGDIEVPPDFAGLAPGEIGLYRIDVPVTAAVPSGPNVPLRVEVTRGNGSVVTSNEVTVAIE